MHQADIFKKALCTSLFCNAPFAESMNLHILRDNVIADVSKILGNEAFYYENIIIASYHLSYGSRE